MHDSSLAGAGSSGTPPGRFGGKEILIRRTESRRPGVTIGSYATIGAGSVVTKDIPPRCVATGNPATVRYLMVDERAPTALVETAYTLEDALKAGRGEDE